MTEEQAIKLFKCLADKSRLQIIKSLSKEEMYVERLAERLNLTPATISFHLKKLEEIKAVVSRKEQYYTIYSLCPEIFMTSILEIIKSDLDQAKEQNERDELYCQKVISTFIEYGKLKSIPRQWKKKKIILEEISKSFDSGKVYSEKEVNLIIADFHDDFCTLRRHMVDLGFLARENMMYRKVT